MIWNETPQEGTFCPATSGSFVVNHYRDEHQVATIEGTGGVVCWWDSDPVVGTEVWAWGEEPVWDVAITPDDPEHDLLLSGYAALQLGAERLPEPVLNLIEGLRR